MSSTPSLVFSSVLMVLGVACASGSPGGTGDGSNSGGTASTPGSTSSGGSPRDEGTGSAAGSGAAPEIGGAQVTGGTGGGAMGGAGNVSGGIGGGATGGLGGHAAGGLSGAAAGGLGPGGSAGGELPSGGHETGGSDHPGTGGSTMGAGGAPGGELVARTIETRGFTFDAREMAADGEPVLLLHGFPDTSLMWSSLMPVLADAGYHCLAPDQRGYSPGARPTEVEAYRYEELVADAFALANELGDRFHLVAHDWGANVGWLMLEADPSRIASFTAISIPHYAVWARSVYEDDEMSWYRSLLDIWMTPGEGEDYWTPAAMRNMWAAKPAEHTERTIAHMMEPGAMTAALNWYRASDGHRSVVEEFDVWEVTVPTLLVHGSDDVGEVAVTKTAPHMLGPYRVVRPAGGHFIVDEQPDDVAAETLAHLRAHPLR